MRFDNSVSLPLSIWQNGGGVFVTLWKRWGLVWVMFAPWASDAADGSELNAKCKRQSAKLVLILREADSLPYGLQRWAKVTASKPIPCRGGYYPPEKMKRTASLPRLRSGSCTHSPSTTPWSPSLRREANISSRLRLRGGYWFCGRLIASSTDDGVFFFSDLHPWGAFGCGGAFVKIHKEICLKGRNTCAYI